MSEKSLEALLNRADALAREGDWQGAYHCLVEVTRSEPQHVGALTGIGACLLQMGQPEQSLPYFLKVVELAPEIPDSHNNLGVAYTLTRQFDAAEEAYKRAIQLNPDHLPAWKNLAQIYLQQQEREPEGAQILAALVQVNPKDVEVLMMLAGCYEKVGEFESAKTLLHEVLKIQPGHAEALAALERLSSSDAYQRIARPEHTRKLAALRERIKTAPILNIEKTSPEVTQITTRSSSQASVAFYAPPGLSSSYQMEMLSQALSANGWRTKFAQSVEKEDFRYYELFLFCQPNLSAELIDGVKGCLQQEKPFLVYLSEDFHHLPQDHPAFLHFGQGNPKALKVLEVILEHAKCLIVPSKTLADRYRGFAKEVKAMLPTWSQRNPLWKKNGPGRSTFNIGWIGSGGDRMDLKMIKREVIKFLQANPKGFLVVASDPLAYEIFSELPEQRRIFLPLYHYEDTPYVLSHFDLLLVPLRQNDYNWARSDLPLLESGVRGIPWLASRIPAFEEWGEGGIILEDVNGWFPAMQSLSVDENARRELGQSGMTKAKTREIEALLEEWQSVLTP